MEQTTLPTPSIYRYKGKAYRVSPCTLSDMLELAKVLRARYMEDANAQLKGLPVPLAAQLWKESKAEADKIQVTTREYEAAMLKADGLIYTLYLAIRREHADFELLTSVEIFTADFDNAAKEACKAMGYDLQINPTKAA
jgi:hypothetical protein